MSKDLRWFWSRLKCMSLPEVAYRIKKTIYIRAQKRGLYLVEKTPKPDLSHHGNSFVGSPRLSDTSLYYDAACMAATGDIPVFALKNARLGMIPNWNRDPIAGITAQRSPAGSSLRLAVRAITMIAARHTSGSWMKWVHRTAGMATSRCLHWHCYRRCGIST